MTTTRSRTPEPPYCWQSKAALRRIREYMLGRDQWQKVSSRLCLYHALCEMASNRGSKSFRASQKALADLCGLSERTQREILRDLQRAGVITASDPENGGQGQKTYTLLSFNAEAGSERTEATSERSEMSVNMPSLPTLEVTLEERKNNKDDQSPSQAQSSASQPVAGSAEKPSPSSSASRPSVTGEKIPLLISHAGLDFAEWFRSTLPERVSLAKGWREQWGRAFDALVRIDKRDPEEIWRVAKWGRADSFWASRFLSPLKLRKRNQEGVAYFDAFSAQMNGSKARRKPSEESFI